jgi:hypothetical protein
VKAKTWVYTLIEYTAEVLIPLQQQNFLNAAFFCGHCRGHAGRPAAYDHKIFFYHFSAYSDFS